MKIKKRSGRLVEFNPNQILQRALKANRFNKDLKDVVIQSVINVQGMLYEGITTSKIDKLLAKELNDQNIQHPDMEYIAGEVLFSCILKDQQQDYENCDTILKETIDKLNLIDKDKFDYSDHKWTYFSLMTFITDFSVKNNDRESVETPYDAWRRVACTLAKSKEEAEKYYEELINRRIALSNPVFVNVGTDQGKLISCTTMSLQEDSLEGIVDTLNSSAIHSSNNSGVGMYIGDVRSKNTYRSKGGKAAGLRQMVKLTIPFSQFFKQNEKRRGAFALYAGIWHLDIEDFIPMKRPDLSHTVSEKDGFYGLCVPDLFYKRLAKKETWSLMCPHQIFKEYGFHLSDYVGAEFEEKYEMIEREAKIDIKTINAGDLMTLVVDNCASSGVPYIFNVDRANEKHQQSYAGVLKSQQLCVKGDTLLLTDKGEFPIETLEGQTVNAWNGFEFSKTPILRTSNGSELMKVSFSNGKSVPCTYYHRFPILRNGKEVIVEAKDLRLGDKLADYYLPFVGDIMLDCKDIIVTGLTKLEGLHPTFCGTEPKRNKLTFNGVTTFNCNEFSGIHNKEFEAQCCLSSIPLHSHVKDGKFDFGSLKNSCQVLTRLLNRVIDVNEWNTPRARRSGEEHRNIGIGLLGLADVFAMLDMVYGDEASRKLNDEIQKTIYLSVLEESVKIASERPEIASKRTLIYTNPEKFDFIPEKLAKDIQKYGVANELLCCNMPTSTTSKIMDCTQSFEVFDYPVSVRDTVGGQAKFVNKHLVRDLEKLGKWTVENKNILLKENDVNVLDVPEHIKAKYENKYRHNNKVYLEMAADRQKYIDQGQSMNLYYLKASRSKISTALYYGWKLGLPTGSYYTTFENTTKGDSNVVQEVTVKRPANSKFQCFGCD